MSFLKRGGDLFSRCESTWYRLLNALKLVEKTEITVRASDILNNIVVFPTSTEFLCDERDYYSF